MLAFIDFLDSREKAILFWGAALVVFATIKGKSVASSMLGVLRALASPKLLLLFGTAAAYCAALVFLASKGGLWHTTAVKETVYWFLGSGVILVGNATQESLNDPSYLKKLLQRVLRFTLVVEFLVNFYVLPLAAELFLVPLITLFIGMQVVAEHDPTMVQARKFIAVVLTLFGLTLMVYVIVSAISDSGELLRRENAEDLLLAPALSLALLPFLYLVSWLSRRELNNVRKRLAGA
jgi:hypothetical protein